jgi:hypothetical protein
MILIANDCGRDGIKSIKYDSDTGEMERLYFNSKFIRVDFDQYKHYPILVDLEKDIIATIDGGTAVAYGNVCNKLSPPDEISFVTNDEIYIRKSVDYTLISIACLLKTNCEDIKIALNFTKNNIDRADVEVIPKVIGNHTVKFFDTHANKLKEITFTVTVCAVYLQGWTTYMNYALDDHYNIIPEYAKAEAIVLDWGRRTVDGMLISLLSHSKPKAFDLGTEILFKYIKDSLDTPPLHIRKKTHEIENIIRTGKPIMKNGEPIDLDTIVKNAMINIVERLDNEIKEEFGDYTVDKYLFTGGGTYLFKDIMMKMYPGIEVSKDPIFDNAMGLIKILIRKFVYKKKGQE